MSMALLRENIELLVALAALLIAFGTAFWAFFALGNLQKKSRYIESGIEKIYREMRDVKSWIESSEKELEFNATKANMRIKSEVEARVKDAVDVASVRLSRDLDLLDSRLSDEKEFLDERLSILESKIHAMGYTPGTATSQVDESKIIELFSQGYSMEQISRQVRIGVGEVEFILKLSGLK